MAKMSEVIGLPQSRWAHSRRGDFPLYRFMIMRTLEQAGYSPKEIGEMFGMSRTGVVNGLQRIADALDCRAAWADRVRKIYYEYTQRAERLEWLELRANSTIKSGYVNVYPGGVQGVFKTREAALRERTDGCSDTVQIFWKQRN